MSQQKAADDRAGSLFGYPKIGRAGLGNELFAWARCFLWCARRGARMIAPEWRQIHIGPYLRREIDKRQYHRLFHNAGYVGGWSKAQALLSSRSIDESGAEDIPQMDNGPIVVRFHGLGEYFTPLLGCHQALRDELLRITRPALLPNNLPAGPFIALHIRLGDFRAPMDENALRSGAWNYRIDLDWYIQAVEALRDVVGADSPALICSDGTEQELAPILRLPQVSLYRTGSPIGDLFALSSARLLVASGSSFSMWASFLGQAPTVWFPGQRRWSLIDSTPQFAAEPELAGGGDLPDGFDQIAVAAWEKKNKDSCLNAR